VKKLAEDLVKANIGAAFSNEPRHGGLNKVKTLEQHLLKS
jgi:hypothetical protein